MKSGNDGLIQCPYCENGWELDPPHYPCSCCGGSGYIRPALPADEGGSDPKGGYPKGGYPKGGYLCEGGIYCSHGSDSTHWVDNDG